MVAQPWNFPTYRVCGSYNFAYDSDPYYTPNNSVNDWSDNASWTFIGAVLLPPGFAASGHAQTTSGTANAYAPIWSLGRYGENDANYCFRTYFDGNNRGFQMYMYDGNASGYIGVITLSIANMLAAGINFEGQMLQIAGSVNQATGKRLLYINGIEMFNDTVTPWATTTGCHRSSNSRTAHNAYANWATTTWSTGGASGEYVTGPRLVHDAFLDLTDPAVRANIWDDNGDFLWPGHNGAGWLGGTTPWYYSEVGVPWNGNRGSATATYSRVTNSSYARWGHPCGSKWDWPNEATAQWTAAYAIPGVKAIFDMSGLFDEQKYFLDGHLLPRGTVKRYTTSYGAYPSYSMRDGAIGAPGYNYSISTYHGYHDVVGNLDALSNGANKIWMTMALDFTQIPTANFGFQKVIGWRSSSSSSYFGCYTVYPSGSGRSITLQYKPGGVDTYVGIGGIPNNTKHYVFTWSFDNGILKRFVNGVLNATWDHSSSGTALPAANGAFGFLDYTSAASGAFPVACDFVAIGEGSTVADAEHIAVHDALMNGAY